MKFSSMVDRQIEKAQREAQFDGLAGTGKPLELGVDGGIEAVGYRIMAQSGAVPREIELRKAVAAQTLVVKEVADDPAALKRERKKLADLQLRLDIEQDARRRFSRG